MFRRQGSGLRYEETGTLTLGGGPKLTATRAYLWQEAGEDILVSFADGRPFHRFARDAQQPSARHECAPDVYLVAYDFRRWPAWTSRWDVRGPRKNYRMITEFTPQQWP